MKSVQQFTEERAALDALLELHNKIADFHPARRPGVPPEAVLKDYRKQLEDLRNRIVAHIKKYPQTEDFTGNIEVIDLELTAMYQDKFETTRGTIYGCNGCIDQGGGLHADYALTVMHSAIEALKWQLGKR